MTAEEREIEWEIMESTVFKTARESFPIMDRLSEKLSERGTLASLVLGWNCHLTEITALAVKALAATGCRLLMSECNPATSEEQAIDYMRECGALVFTGENARSKVLEAGPQVVSDTGFDLLSAYLETGGSGLLGASEITTSGIQRLRRLRQGTDFPVINLNDGIIKSRIENFHGVGDGVVESLSRLVHRDWGGARVAVVGYGMVGQGVASYLRRLGPRVLIVDSDPVARLLAHYDGYEIASLDEAARCELVVTATGRRGLIGEDFFARAADSLILLNVGHWPDEIDVKKLKQICSKVEAIGPDLERFTLADPLRSLYLACSGNPANVAMLTGSIEPTLLHLTTEILSMEFIYLHHRSLEMGENALPRSIEEEVSELALSLIGMI